MNPRIIALLAVLASAEQALAGDPAGLAGVHRAGVPGALLSDKAS